MNHISSGLTDLEVVLHCDVFRCHVCGEEPPFLYRVRLQEWPTHAYALEEDERFVIRRRLVCNQCLRTFRYPENVICGFATIAGRTWCLRQRPHDRPVVYTRERWLRYVDHVRLHRLM